MLLITWSCLPSHLAGQGVHLKFKHISIEQGLSNSTVETIFQDRRGFLWFGTRDGLNRYDGKQITVFRFNVADTNSISDNFIRCIYEDRVGVLWVGTNNGLNKFDISSNRFKRFKEDNANPKSLGNNTVTSIFEDRKGALWVGTWGGGLNLFLSKENGFLHFRSDKGKQRSLSSDKINCLFEDSKGKMWVGTDNGLNFFDRDNQLFRLTQGPDTVADDIRAIQEDRMGNLVIGTLDNGLLIFNVQENSFTRFRHNDKESRSLGSNLVRSVLIDKSWNIWIGGINGGLNLFDPLRKTFDHYQNEPENNLSLSQRTVSSLFEDNQGNLWVGTHRGGVNLYTPNAEKFTLYRQTLSGNSLSYNDVKAFCEDKLGNLWIGTDGGGLNQLDRHTGIFRHFKNDPFNIKSIASNEVLDITEDSERNLWVGTWGGGLCLFNHHDQTFTRFTNDPSNSNSISSNYVQQIFEDSKKNLWVATYYGGLNVFDRKSKKFSRFVGDSQMATKLTGNNIVSMAEDSSGNIWIGTDDGGLNCYHSSSKLFTHYFTNTEKTPDLRVIFVDSKNRLWIGQEGLYLFNSSKNQFDLYAIDQDLNTSFIKGMEEDDQGDFWISTSNGLCRINPEKKIFKKYNAADGLQSLEFEANAYLKTKSGELFFGGVNGYNSFFPENIRANNFIAPIYITGFQLSNKKVIPGQPASVLSKDISFTKEIYLSYKQSTFSFDFATLNYTALENNQYAYKLDNWDKDWNYPGNEGKASYTNVRPGNYTFRVRASNNDGVWNDDGPIIKIIITPPFWDTWWFKSIIALIIVGSTILLYFFRQNLELRKLEEQKKEEVHQMQLQFFTNISHEFRTPLSLILGPLEKLQKENKQQGSANNFQVMYRNANRLMNLINELMDFRKSESGVLKLNVMPGDIDIFLQELSEEFSELAIEKNMEFTVKVPQGIDDAWFDRQILEKIMINLIGNSFKYTGNRGTIKLEVTTSLHGFKPAFENELVLKNDYLGKRYVFFRIIDNGIGISKESISHLFERYYRINETHMGSGIGLAFVRSLTTLHKGNIHVYSERHKGTEIIVSIPISKDDYEDHERWLQQRNESKTRLENVFQQDEGILALKESGIKEKLPELSKPHILVTEDNEELRRFLMESLNSHYEVSEAADGQAGLKKAKEEFPDLIISDVMMPGMDGLAFCRLIKEDIETSHIPFLMLTAKDALVSRIEGMESGADYYFAKPLSIELLLATLKNIFQQKQVLKERYAKDKYVDAKELVHNLRDKEFLQQLINIIEQNLTTPDMDVDYICTQIGMSKTKLYQKIKKITGQSIGEFTRTIRFKKAAQLMTTENISITEVMYSVGIQTQSYFTKAFKKEFGKTPTQFLKDLEIK